MKKFLKNWNWFEICFLTISLILITTFFIVGDDKNWLSLTASLLGIVTVLLVAKGLVIAQFFVVVHACLYSALSYTQHYYGEMIIYIGLMIPIGVLSIISWLRNRNKENLSQVQVNKIHGKEYIMLGVVTAVATVGFYFILKALDTSELIVSTLSLITSAVAAYLSLRRCSYYAIAYIINDVILITLWSLSVINYGVAYLPTLISFVLFFINDIYGLIHWKWEEKKQQKSHSK